MSSSGAGAGDSRSAALFQVAVPELPDRLVEARRPIRVLNALQWDESGGRNFPGGGAHRLPEIDADG